MERRLIALCVGLAAAGHSSRRRLPSPATRGGSASRGETLEPRTSAHDRARTTSSIERTARQTSGPRRLRPLHRRGNDSRPRCRDDDLHEDPSRSRSGLRGRPEQLRSHHSRREGHARGLTSRHDLHCAGSAHDRAVHLHYHRRNGRLRGSVGHADVPVTSVGTLDGACQCGSSQDSLGRHDHRAGPRVRPDRAGDRRGAVSKTVKAPKKAKSMRVRYTVKATDAVDGAVATKCTPRSGSAFKVGRTKVTCSATTRAATRPRRSSRSPSSAPETRRQPR